MNLVDVTIRCGGPGRYSIKTSETSELTPRAQDYTAKHACVIKLKV